MRYSGKYSIQTGLSILLVSLWSIIVRKWHWYASLQVTLDAYLNNVQGQFCWKVTRAGAALCNLCSELDSYTKNWGATATWQAMAASLLDNAKDSLMSLLPTLFISVHDLHWPSPTKKAFKHGANVTKKEHLQHMPKVCVMMILLPRQLVTQCFAINKHAATLQCMACPTRWSTWQTNTWIPSCIPAYKTS